MHWDTKQWSIHFSCCSVFQVRELPTAVPCCGQGIYLYKSCCDVLGSGWEHAIALRSQKGSDMVIPACFGCLFRCPHVAREGTEKSPISGPPDCQSKARLCGMIGRSSFPNLACDDTVHSCQTGPLEYHQSWNLHILVGFFLQFIHLVFL